MIGPVRALSMPLAARLVTRYDAVRLASSTDAKSSSLIRRSNPSFVTPAFETSTSTVPPKCSSTAANAASTCAESVTSHCTPNKPSGGGDE